jgi:hypothetical protein
MSETPYLPLGILVTNLLDAVYISYNLYLCFLNSHTFLFFRTRVVSVSMSLSHQGQEHFTVFQRGP